MKKLLTPGRKFALPLLLLATCAGSHAQSLGAPSAMAWIGRPLEMTVPARFASADARDECVHADVLFGDTRLPPHRVRATLLGTDPQHKRIRIETDAVIDEPVVTVSVRAGCRGAVTRSYTLLPELASEQVVAGLAAQRPGAGLPAAPLSPAMAAAAAMAPLQLAAATRAAPPPRSRAVRPVAAAPRDAAPAGGRSARAGGPRPAVASAPSGPRLRLEPIEADSSTLLRVSTQLAEPAGDAGRRAAAALLWQAINADPQEVLRTTVMLQNLERDLAQLRQDTGRTRAEMASLRQRLDAAQPWYGSAATLQVLGLLLLAAVAAAGVFRYRTRHSAVEHWYAQVPPVQPEFQHADAAAAAAPPETMPVPAEPPVAVAVAPAPASAVRAASAHRRGTDAVLRVETLAATFEEVEFLSSLGLAADAAAVLKSYLQDSASPAPIAFFEWMRLCEHGDDVRAAAAARHRYAELFGAEPPPLEQVTAPLGLESLAGLSASITAAWHTPRVLKVIEDALFGVPAAGPPLTLQAGRELLCLHDVATSLASEASATPAAGEGPALAPWANAEDAAGAQLAVQSLADVGDGSVFSVDIDLGAAPAPKLEEPAVSPLIAQLQAAAREAEERAALKRRQEEEEEAFSAAVASERMPLARH